MKPPIDASASSPPTVGSVGGYVHYSGLTIQLPVTDVTAARMFYTTLFGRAPDFTPHDDFLEWQVVPNAEVWAQVTAAQRPPPATGRLRLRVTDIRASVERVERELDVRCDPLTSLPGVVAFTNFVDPWANPLGFYEDLVPSADAVGPGGSVHDESLFRTGVVDTPDPPP